MLNNVVLRMQKPNKRAHAEDRDEIERSIGSVDPFALATAKKREIAMRRVKEILVCIRKMRENTQVYVSEWIVSEYVDQKYGRLTTPSLIFLRLTFHQYSLGQECPKRRYVRDHAY